VTTTWMPGFHLNEMGEMVLDAIDDIGVVDVYDLASDIGKEYERIMDRFGTDAVSGLMPKIINTLELLEALATKNEREIVRREGAAASTRGSSRRR